MARGAEGKKRRREGAGTPGEQVREAARVPPRSTARSGRQMVVNWDSGYVTRSATEGAHGTAPKAGAAKTWAGTGLGAELGHPRGRRDASVARAQAQGSRRASIRKPGVRP